MRHPVRRSATLIFATALGAAVLAPVSAVATTHPAGAARAAALASWGTAQTVPGIGALTTSTAQLNSVSCASAGNCSAGGNYADGSGNGQAFVVNEVNGTWQNAEEVPSTPALNTGGSATVTSVSCPSADNCSAAGHYSNSAGLQQVFVVSETNGTWQNAEEVPGTAALNGGYDSIGSVSCRSAGNCSAGGYYQKTPLRHQQAFVVNETNGTWQNAEEIAGALNLGGDAETTSVSCTSGGKCGAVGIYGDGSSHPQPFVVSKT